MPPCRFFSIAVYISAAFISMAMVDAPSAWARRGGIAAAGCEGCHNGGSMPTVTLTATPENPAVGQVVTLTVTISQTNGSVAGFFLTTEGPNNGTFRASDTGTAVNGGGIIHTTPRTGTGGVTTFKAEWTATQATGVQFSAYALSCNGDGSARGDGGGSAMLGVVSGCVGANYYIDQDGDGFGTNDTAYPIRKDCQKPVNYAPVTGDCNDFSSAVRPGAPELCDMKDNNCDGKIDESIVPQQYCEDKDGDGHGIPSGLTKMDCMPTPGFGDCGGDCNDNSKSTYPGAPEVCDSVDNNCNGTRDEGVRMTCGVGWCRKYAEGCTSICTPGPPMVETCNLFDDDCDGVMDNGSDQELCGTPGTSCVAGRCVAGGGGIVSGGGGGGGRAGSSSGSAGSKGTGGRGAGSSTSGGGQGSGSTSGDGSGEIPTGTPPTTSPPANPGGGGGGCSVGAATPPRAHFLLFTQVVAAFAFGLAGRSRVSRRRQSGRLLTSSSCICTCTCTSTSAIDVRADATGDVSLSSASTVRGDF